MTVTGVFNGEYIYLYSESIHPNPIQNVQYEVSIDINPEDLFLFKHSEYINYLGLHSFVHSFRGNTSAVFVVKTGRQKVSEKLSVNLFICKISQ